MPANRIIFCSVVVAVLAVFRVSTAPAQNPGDVTMLATAKDSLRLRALATLNALEVWSYATVPEQTTGTYLGHIRCEPNSAQGECLRGTLPVCLYCGHEVDFRNGRTPLFDNRQVEVAERRAFATIDSVLAIDPSDRPLIGIAIYLRVRRSLYSAAEQYALAPRCGLAAEECALLRAFVLQSAGRWTEADEIFTQTLPLLTDERRCTMEDASAILDGEFRERYLRSSCTDRRALNSSLWWLSDPSYFTHGNDRHTEHFARVVGNEILSSYRMVTKSVDGIPWLAQSIPAADTRQNSNPRRWESNFFPPPDVPPDTTLTRPPWRWDNELTRFGSIDAMEILGEKALAALGRTSIQPLVCLPRPASSASRNSRSSSCMPMVVEVRCPMGFERSGIDGSAPSSIMPTSSDSGRRSISAGWYLPSHPPDLVWGWYERHCIRSYNTRARHQFTPDNSVIVNPFAAPSTAWKITGDSGLFGGTPMREQYSPPYGPVHQIVNYQLARFPRGDSMLLVAVAAGDSTTHQAAARTSGWFAGMIATGEVPPRTEPTSVRTTTGARQLRYELSMVASATNQFVGVEIHGPAGAGYAMLRQGLLMSPWLVGRTTLSDPLIIMASTADSVANLMTATKVAVTGARISVASPIGVYWELRPDPSVSVVGDYEVTLEMLRIDEVRRGLLARVLGTLTGSRSTPRGTSRVRFSIGAGQRTSDGVIPGTVNVSTGALTAGRYRLVLTVSGAAIGSVSSEREIVLTRIHDR